jgi:hypothetical protein
MRAGYTLEHSAAVCTSASSGGLADVVSQAGAEPGASSRIVANRSQFLAGEANRSHS